MDLLGNLGLGIETALRLENVLYCFIGVVLGTGAPDPVHRAVGGRAGAWHDGRREQPDVHAVAGKCSSHTMNALPLAEPPTVSPPIAPSSVPRIRVWRTPAGGEAMRLLIVTVATLLSSFTLKITWPTPE